MRYIQQFEVWHREDEPKDYYRGRPDFHCGVLDGDVVKLDRDYIESLSSLTWRNVRGETHEPIKDKDFDKEFTLVMHDPHYGYSLRNIGKKKFFGWVPDYFIRHLNEFELATKKYNL